VIGAHYDVQNSESHCWRGSRESFLVTQGADDNGSGAVACVDLLRRFKEKNIVFSRTVFVVLFDGEEPGLHCHSIAIGSKFFIDEFGEEYYDDIKLAFIIDMLGGPICDEKAGFVLGSNHTKEDLLQEMIDQHFTSDKVTIGSSVNLKTKKYNSSIYSDSRNFLKHQIPTILLSNVGSLNTLPYFYHTEHDTIDIIDWESFGKGIDIAETLIVNNSWYNY